jgi:hypothetical protein
MGRITAHRQQIVKILFCAYHFAFIFHLRGINCLNAVCFTGGDKNMKARTRSPSYPSTPIEQAIVYARKLHQEERTNPIDRAVAAKAMGYSGITGRSATILSDLSQYGLIEKAGKSEIRVTPLAVEILHPDDPHTWGSALKEAIKRPELYQRIMERFTDGRPSANALESFLVKQGFTFAAIPAAVRAFQETYSYLENAIEDERNSTPTQDVQESTPYQHVDEAKTMQHFKQAQPVQAQPVQNHTFYGGGAAGAESGPSVSFSQKKIWLGGVISNQEEAEELIATLTALKPMLKWVSPAQKLLNKMEDDDFQE